jgi:hypothetical protein
MKLNVISLVFLVIIQFTSFLCTVYLLVQYGKKKSLLRRLPNHLILCLLIVSAWLISLDLISTEYYYWYGYVPIQTAWACRIYNLSIFFMTGLNRFFMAMMSVERHFLVFRRQFYYTRRSRVIFHYIPIIIIIIWILSYSITTDVLVSCPQNRFRYSSFLCGFTCSLLLPNLVMIYVWIQVFLPTSITMIACILLPIRFAIQKRNLQRFQWHRARKMIIQMISIAGAYTICWFPYVIILQLISTNQVSLSQVNKEQFMIFGPYITSLITPFICLYTISTNLKLNLIKQITRYLFRGRQARVHPHLGNT